MKYGISTGCFFPKTPKEALINLTKIGVKYAEIFINADSELSKEYLLELKKIADEGGVEIVAIHPFTSAIEGFLFFSKFNYVAKLEDSIKFYERYFRACNILGAKYVVFHGSFLDHTHISLERYAQIMNILADKACEYGVYISQENVNKYVSHSKENLEFIYNNTRDNLLFTFDIKQAVRAKEDIYSILNVMKNRLSHVHISDFTESQDSLLPGVGDFDFRKFAEYVKNNTTAKVMLIEVYEDRYDDINSLKKSLEFLRFK